MNINDIRREYTTSGLSKNQLHKNPMAQFKIWLSDMIKTDILDPTAMSVATVSKDGMPSLRTVLLKYYDNNSFVFFTHLKSRKATELQSNNKISLLFPWAGLNRQVVVTGYAEFISTTESLKYFLTRPKKSQIAAWASQQSRAIESREILEEAFAQFTQKFKHAEMSLPDFWGGVRVNPVQIEFWQGRKNRLHDRFLYSKGEDDNWSMVRLAP